MADARTLMSLSLKDEATRQLKTFEGNFKRTMKNVESTDDGGGAYAQLVADVSSAEGALTMLGATAPQVAAAMLALGAASTAVDWARQAAEAQAVDAAFVRLAGSVGSSGASMLASMRAASSGMIADMDLMLAANTAMALGVADTAGEMTALLQVAIAKGAELGVAPMKAFGDLINGLGRMSPEILNNIGVVVDAESAYAAYAKSINSTVDRLNEQQKMQALVNAVLAANPDAARQAAAAGDSAAAAFARWDVATRQFSETFGSVFLPAIADGLDLVTRFVNAVGGVGDALAGKIEMTPEQIDVDITAAQTQIADYETPGKYADASKEIARLRDQIAMLEQAKRLLIGTTDGVAAATQREGAASQDAAVQSTRLSAAAEAVRARLAALASQSDTTSGALRSMWTNAAGALGAAAAFSGWQKQQQELETLVGVWSQYGRMSPEQLDFQKAAWLDVQNDKLQEQVQALAAVDQAAGRAASGGLSQMNQAYNDMQGRVGSVISASLSLDPIGVNPSDFLPRPDAVQEDAFRLADVMVNGFASPWAAYFESTFPALFKEMTAAGDIQAGAAAILQQFQAGMRPELLNFDAIKEKVKAALAMDDAIAGIRDQITAELTGAGASASQVQSALSSVLGGLGTGGEGAAAATVMAVTVTPDFDLAAMRGAGASAGVEFAAGMDPAGVANKFSQAFMLGMKDFYTRFYASGAASANEYNSGFLAQWKATVPVEVVLTLAALVTPEVLAAIDARNSRTGAQ